MNIPFKPTPHWSTNNSITEINNFEIVFVVSTWANRTKVHTILLHCSNNICIKQFKTFFSNKAETFQIGLWESTEGSISGPSTYHEFMYPLKGEIVLTNSNGERLVTKPGQGVIVPANWDGEFSVPQGVLKIWIIYQE